MNRRMYRLASSGEMGAPCGVPRPLSLFRVVRRLPSPLVGFLHRRFQPHLDQMQHVPIADPTSHRLHQFGVRDAVEVTAQVRIDHFRMPRSAARRPSTTACQGTSPRPVGVLFRLQVGLEDRFQHQHRCRLHDTIPDRGDSQRPGLPSGLGYAHPSDRVRTIRLLPEFLRQFASHLHARTPRCPRTSGHPRPARRLGAAAAVGVSSTSSRYTLSYRA